MRTDLAIPSLLMEVQLYLIYPTLLSCLSGPAVRTCEEVRSGVRALMVRYSLLDDAVGNPCGAHLELTAAFQSPVAGAEASCLWSTESLRALPASSSQRYLCDVISSP